MRKKGAGLKAEGEEGRESQSVSSVAVCILICMQCQSWCESKAEVLTGQKAFQRVSQVEYTSHVFNMKRVLIRKYSLRRQIRDNLPYLTRN